jgi:TatD DNase family protein
MQLTDAHCHLQDARFGAQLNDVLARCRELGLTRWMVNATRESDWENVAALVRTHPGLRCSFGLHPWWQAQRSANWLADLEGFLTRYPEAGIGETGLDRWMEGFDMEDQTAVLLEHLKLSRQLNRAITLHCLRAWPELAACIKRCPPSKRGFLLHSFNGPPTMLSQWVDLGAYFSFSPAFLHPKKAALRELFTHIPAERLLVESDAPDMAPPRELAVALLEQTEERLLNHPGNVVLCLNALAAVRGLAPETLALQLEQNYERLFGN